MLSRFFIALWGELRAGNPGAFMALIVLAVLITLIVLICTYHGPECTKYTISYGDYRFDVNNYSQTENSVTFQRGSTNITLVGDFAIYENDCEGE
jgi:hypothetical protein